MLKFHNPYADEEDEKGAEPETQPETEDDVVKQIRENISRIKQNQESAPRKTPKNLYHKPGEAKMEDLISSNEAFLKAWMDIYLAVVENQQRPDGAVGFLFVGEDAGNIQIVPADAAIPYIGGIRVREYPFAQWLLENYRADFEILRKGRADGKSD